MDDQLFSEKAKTQAPTPEVTSIATRLKLAEERYSNLLKRNQLNESTLLDTERELRADLNAITEKTVELRRQVADINTKVDAILGEVSSVVQKHEFSVVERYLDLWQPMQWVTREEAKRIAQEVRRG